jgi:hypothetical protein
MCVGRQYGFGRGRLLAVAAVAAVAMTAPVRARAEDVAGAEETERLRKQVRVLSEELSATRLRADRLAARLDRRTFAEAHGAGVGPATRPALDDAECRVLEVNKELGVAVLNAGRRQGLRPGLEFAVMDGDRVVATLRTTDVRASIAGAVIQRSGRSHPRAQDRAVLASGSRE